MTLRQLGLLAAPLLFLSSCDARTAEPPNADSGSSENERTIAPRALAGRVTDAADVLDAAQEAILTGKLEELERRHYEPGSIESGAGYPNVPIVYDRNNNPNDIYTADCKCT